jgi:hypothetical protein
MAIENELGYVALRYDTMSVDLEELELKMPYVGF